MNKAELVAVLADNSELAKKDVESVIDALFEEIQKTLVTGEKVVISGFGTFEVRKREARTGRNPRTGEDIHIPEQLTPAFKAGKGLKDSLR